MLTANEIAEARERLAEHNAMLWTGEEEVDETKVELTRYWAGINELQIDSFMEYLRRFCSVSNQNVFELTGADHPAINGLYYDTGAESNGHAVFLRDDGAYEFRVAVSQDTGAYYWQVIRISDGAVLWISSGGSVVLTELTEGMEIGEFWLMSEDGVLVPVDLGTELLSLSSVVWTNNDPLIDLTEGLEIGEGWEFSGDGVIEPVTGALVVDSNVPSLGIVYRSITDPLVNNGKVREGIWRAAGLRSAKDHDGRYGANGAWVILQDLRLGYVTTLGSGGDVDWSEFALELESGFHSDRYMPVLRLYNVAATAVHDLVAYLNQDTFTDIDYRDDTLDGTWRRVEVRAVKEEKGGAYYIDVLLTDSSNTDLYVRFKQGPNTWKGLYHKWDADETTIEELEATVRFESDGSIDADPASGTSKTLREVVVGRTVQWSRVTRNPSDRLFELVADITWNAATIADTSGTPSGMYSQQVWFERFINAEDLPDAADLEPVHDDGSDYTNTTYSTRIPVLGEKWHMIMTDKYYVCILANAGLQDLTNTTYFTDTGIGLWRIDKDLVGPRGSGIPELNEDGSQSYAILSRKTVVVDGGWHMLSAPSYDTKRAINRVFSGIQPIRQRLGGELAFEVDSSGALSGVDWNLEWDDAGNTNGGTYPDDTAPDNWVTHGYRSRYGDWKGHWTKGHVIGANSLRSPAHAGATCRGVFSDDSIYQIGDVAYYAGSGDTPTGAAAAGFYELVSSTLWIAGTTYAEGDVRQSGNKVYTCIAAVIADQDAPGSAAGADKWSEGTQGGGTWAAIGDDLIVSKIAIDGVGDSPFEQPDFHIPIQQELQEEVEWDFDWEWNATDTYAANWIGFFLNDAIRYKNTGSAIAGESPATDPAKWTAVTEDPSGWDSAYSDRYGDWRSSWTKGYATGAGSLRTNPDGALVCRGPYAASALYQIGDVAAHGAVRETPLFKAVSGATLWVSGTNYSEGDVRQSGSKVYTCIAAVIADSDAPGTAAGAATWSAGALGSAVTWSAFDEAYVLSKLGTLGVGTEPFETFVTVGVLNEDGTNAYSRTARYSFYNNFAINPRVAEAFRCTLQRIQTLELVSYFAINPHYLLTLGGRVPTSWADLAAIKTDAEDSTDGVLTLDYNTDQSNFGMSYKIEKIDSSMDVWVVRKTIVLRTEEEFDSEAAQTILNRLGSSSSGGKQGDLVVVKHDLTGLGGNAWSGNFLDVS